MFSSVTARWTLLKEQPGEKQKAKRMLAWCTSVVLSLPDTLFSFSSGIMFTTTFKCHQVIFFPTTPSNLLCTENITSAPSPATSVPLSCLVFPTMHTAFWRTTYFTCSHNISVVWLSLECKILEGKDLCLFCTYLPSNWNRAGKGPDQMPTWVTGCRQELRARKVSCCSTGGVFSISGVRVTIVLISKTNTTWIRITVWT